VESLNKLNKMGQDSIDFFVNLMIADLETTDAMAFLQTHEEKINEAKAMLSRENRDAFNQGVLHGQNGNV
jgi:tagatose-1,6-bisphosphate aldolase